MEKTSDTDKTAIVGMACRVAGANNPSELWDNIIKKVDLQQEIPKDRFNIDRFYHPDSKHKGTTSVKYGYFIDQPIDAFDHSFFGISGKEAEAMDPQQRLILEVVYEALEDAGITLETISGTKTSVFVGTFTNDYAQMVARDMEFYPRYAVNGISNAILANRVSFFYNLRGPSVTLDTACSASLVGFHLGNESLLRGESEYCIVVGSALNFIPNTWQIMTDLGLLSVDGRCRAFDAKGGGYVRGEGVCAVVLRRLMDAEKASDSVRAVIRATGTNHDGMKPAIGLPSAESQEELLRDTYQKAGLCPDDTQFFEAHGTGTKAGDPREARAIASVFATSTRTKPLMLGSVKTNIGHLEGAAGLVGVIKVVLALEARKIPPNMLFEDPHPDIPFEDWKLLVPTTELDWNVQEGVTRRASINSFGYGGANAHVVLEEHSLVTYPMESKTPEQTHNLSSRPFLLPITSQTKAAGINAAESLSRWLQSHPDTRIVDLAGALVFRRSFHKYRAYLVGDSTDNILKQVSSADSSMSWLPSSTSPRISFIFTGQGAQSSGMGRQLFHSSHTFRKSLQDADAILKTIPDGPGWSIIDELFRPEVDTNLRLSEYSQPICTALQVALVDLIKSWGVLPNAVCGHSSGEIAAAYASGFLSFKEAILVAYFRGLHMGRGACRAGGMLAVGLGEKDALDYIQDFKGQLVVAAINSPKSVTISGDEDAILQLQHLLINNEIFVRRLQVEQAFHSHHMIPLAPRYRKSLDETLDNQCRSPSCNFFSSVTGNEIKSSEGLGAAYWVDNMVKPVRFENALTKLVLQQAENDEENCILVEIGPHPALRGPIRQTLASIEKKASHVATLNRDRPAFMSLLEGMGQLFSHGCSVDLLAANGLGASNGADAKMAKLPKLPTYSWNHQRSWSKTRIVGNHLHQGRRHTILGVTAPGSTPTSPRWRNYLRPSEIPWLNDHVFDGKALFPGAGYITMAIEAVIRADHRNNRVSIRSVDLKQINIKAPMNLSSSEIGTEVHTELRNMRLSAKTFSDEWHEFSISSYGEDGKFIEHCTGLISVRVGDPRYLESSRQQASIEQMIENATRRVKAVSLYQQILDNGLLLGRRFTLTKSQVLSGPDYVVVPTVEFQPSHYTQHEIDEGTFLYPTILDNCFQSLFLGIENNLGTRLKTVFVPTYIESLHVSGLMEHQSKVKASQFALATHVSMPNNRTSIGHVNLCSNGEIEKLLLMVKGLEMTAVGDTCGSLSERKLFFNQIWQPCFGMLNVENATTHLKTVNDSIALFQFQNPQSKVLLLSPNIEACSKIMASLDKLYDTRGGFKAVHVHIIQETDQKLDITGLQFICEIVMVNEPSKEYGLVISVDQSMDWAQMIKWVTPHTTILTNYPLETENDWETPIILTDGAIFRPGRKSLNPENIVVITSMAPCTRESELARRLKQEINVRRSFHLNELPNTSIEGRSKLVITIGMSSTADNWDSSEWDNIRYLLQIQNIETIWLLDEASASNSQPKEAMIDGLLRVARNENTSSKFISLAVNTEALAPQLIMPLAKILESDSDEEEYIFRDNTFYIPRILENKSLNSQIMTGGESERELQRFDSQPALSLQIGNIGLLETLRFSPDPEILDLPLKEDDVEIRVMASALNFRDVAATMGIVQDEKLGDECAGMVHRIGTAVDPSAFSPGDRVVACRPGQGAHRTYVRQPAALCVKIPENLSYTVAASWSGVLTTAFYSLTAIARLQSEETILIHSGSGGVGQMAIQLAQKIGAKVFTTCSDGKRAFLRQRFGLSDDQIFSSRDDSFVQEIMKSTNNRGVDVILNSLAGKLLTATWGCIAPFGRFVEIGKRDIHQNANLSMAPFRRNVIFASVDLVMLYETQPKLAQQILRASAKLIHSGEILPASPISEFSYAEFEKAMRLMQNGKHLGKIVMVPHSDDMVPVSRGRKAETPLFKPQKIYLIVGGVGGLGSTLAQWMVMRGCRRIISFSRSGEGKETARTTVNWLRGRGIEIKIVLGDVTVKADVDHCINTAGSELAGIFFAPVILDDALICHMTHEQWLRGIKVKCRGADILHDSTASPNVNLDFFIAFSSTSTVTGNKGQANYSASNAYLDALMEMRRRQGLPGISINIGGVTGAGLTEDNPGILKNLRRMKHDLINEDELISQIEEAVKMSLDFNNHSHRQSQGSKFASCKLREQNELVTGINITESDVFWAERSRFRNLYVNRTYNGAQLNSGKTYGLFAALNNANSTVEKFDILQAALIVKVSAVMGVPIESLAPRQSLLTHGLDSIVAVELKKWLLEAAGVEVSLFDIMNMSSIQALVQTGLKV